MKKLKAEGCDNLDPAQLDLEAESDLNLIMVNQHIAKAQKLLEKDENWQISHPLTVKITSLPSIL